MCDFVWILHPPRRPGDLRLRAFLADHSRAEQAENWTRPNMGLPVKVRVRPTYGAMPYCALVPAVVPRGRTENTQAS